MGLDTTHNCWHGSYSGFGQFRAAIAEAAGWAVDDSGNYIIPDEKIPDQAPLPDETITEDGETYTIKWSEAYDNKVWLGWWDEDPADPLDVLLVHSDCEGIIPIRFLMPLAARLEGLLPQVDGWQAHIEQFVTGLRAAYILQEDVDFR